MLTLLPEAALCSDFSAENAELEWMDAFYSCCARKQQDIVEQFSPRPYPARNTPSHDRFDVCIRVVLK
ncbi:hypothetical protein ABTD37_20210, partial [Acinetobacter baumannii]